MTNKAATKKKSSNKDSLKRLNIRISGSGGQGVISTAMLLGEAIAIGDGRNVSQSQAYGPEARGGATRADVIISDEEIFFPECNALDILIAFTYEAYEKFARLAKPEGLVIADEGAVDVLVGSSRTIQIPFINSARQLFKRPIVANIIALGFLATYTGIVTRDSLQEVVTEQYDGSPHLELNQQALAEGFRQGEAFKKEHG
ncbi:MAG: 2-oxoacid:ferredoxin oxidoreductase subunit gamma [Deltaproteobacteria bacterium]|nr:2-oxoacid:ferredoxin oxidoreductase subunit gamma [Deltaproteobacteria bacterium]